MNLNVISQIIRQGGIRPELPVVRNRRGENIPFGVAGMKNNYLFITPPHISLSRSTASNSKPMKYQVDLFNFLVSNREANKYIYGMRS